MTGRRRGRGRPAEKRPRRRFEAEVVRFDCVRLASGLYMHKTTRVIIPIRERHRSRRAR